MKTILPTRISIPKPCREDWGKMTTTDHGKFCSVCTKEVTDFSKMSDDELQAYFAKGGQLSCGNFRADQLYRPSLFLSFLEKIFFRLKLQTVSLYAFLFAGILVAPKAKAQEADSTRTDLPPDEKSVHGEAIIYLFKGNVHGISKKAIDNALVTIRRNREDVADGYTDQDGNFFINVPGTGHDEKFEVNIYHRGFKEKTIRNFVPTVETVPVEMRKVKRKGWFARKHRRGRMIYGAMF